MSNESKPSPQHFLDLTEGDLQEWRLLAPSRLLVVSLRNDQFAALRECAAASAGGELARASYQSGWAACAAQIEQSIVTNRAAPPVDTEQTTTLDPAMRKANRPIKVVTP